MSAGAGAATELDGARAAALDAGPLRVARASRRARLDAECLLAHALGSDRLRLYLDFEKPVRPEERARFRELVRRRADERVPVAQLTGRKEFWSLAFEVTPDVLMPRPETETLVGLAPRPRCRTARRELTVLDVGTGSGAIAVALATRAPEGALHRDGRLARRRSRSRARNAERSRRRGAHPLRPGRRLRAGARASASTRCSRIRPTSRERDAGGLAPELRHEPRAALFAGPDGHRSPAPARGARCATTSRPAGAPAFEVGVGQADAVAALAAAEAGSRRSAVARRDLAGAPEDRASEGVEHGAG